MTRRGNAEQRKETRVKSELLRLETLFEGIDANRRDFVQRQIEELSWLVVSVSDLQKQIDEEGAVLEYQNGRNQMGYQQNPAIKILSDYVKHVTAITKVLMPLVPDKHERDELDEFRHMFDDDNETKEERKERLEREHEEFIKLLERTRITEDA